MPIDPEFASVMNDTVTWRPVQREGNAPKRDLYGKEEPDTSAEQDLKCLIEDEQRRVRGRDGSEQTSSSTLYLYGVYGVTVDDEIEKADGTKPPIIAVSTYHDEDGPYAEVIYLG